LIGETVYIDGEPVENVLVSASGYNKIGTEGDVDIDRLIGPLADYKLYFPMSYTDDLTGKKVTVRGIECEVIGHPDHEHPDRVFGTWSTPWDMAVAVKRVLPWNAEYVTIRYAATGRDVMGNRITAEPAVIWQGMAQARQEKSDETVAATGRVSSSTYYFVVPYIQGIYVMPTQRLSVLYRNKVFDVASIEDIDEKHETLSIRATWRDTDG
jgi:head-tail adaptor